MKNTITSFTIFIILILILTFSIKFLNKTCLAFEKRSEELEDCINSENWVEAYDISNNFLKDWQNTSDRLSIFIHHSELDPINSESFRMIQYVKCKNRDESLASVHTIKLLLRHIKNSEKINIQNIF